MGRRPHKKRFIYRYHDRILKTNYLKHYKVVKKWAMEKYKLSSADIDMIIFIYDEKIFTQWQFDEFQTIFPWDKKRFRRLKDEGWIVVYKKKDYYAQTPNYYEISFKGKKLVDRIYKLLNGEEDFPTSERRNPVMKRKSYSDKVYSTRMYEINRANQQQRLHRSLE